MSSYPNSKYNWAIHLPNMIRLYMTGMSIPEICREIQDEATGFTPKQRMVYNIFLSEGFPTEKTERDKFLKLNIAGHSGFGAIFNSSRTHRMLPETPPVQANEFYDVASHQSTGSAFAANALALTPMIQSGDVAWIANHANSPDEQYGTGHSGAFGAPTELQSPDISNALDLITMSDQVPLMTTEGAQGQASINMVPGTSLDAVLSPQMVQSSDIDSNSFRMGSWFNNGTLSGFDGQQHSPQRWDLEGLVEHHDCGAHSTIADDHDTPQLPLVVEAHSVMRDHYLGESTLGPQPCSAMNQTQSDISSAVSLENPNNSRNTSVRDGDTLMDTFKNPADTKPDSYRSRMGKSENRSATLRSRHTPSPVDNASLGARGVSWRIYKPRLGLKHLYNRSCTPDICDSGYNSGRSSLLRTSVEHPRSLAEFKWLYRVPCVLHEPQPLISEYIPQSTRRFKDTETCTICLYSGIHNLGWSARYLKLEVFQAELRLDGLYDPAALDKAGNSALHYAASGGAGYEHFAALIKAGVNRYQMNTAGQLFLHCLRPYIKQSGSDDLDEDLLDVFNADLINLLNDFQLKGACRWRDNEGRTVFDALASHITNTEMRDQTFRALKDAGYSPKVSKQFPRTPAKQGASNNPSSANVLNFALTQQRQDKAYQIFTYAEIEDPTYVDPDTGDNVLHALARLKLTESRALLCKIQEFVSKDIDLNLQNRKRDCPLAAFISERPCLGRDNDETGATMSKYLDALLWKDARHRIPNKINVNMRNHEGATALYYAATRARPDSVRSLIEAGANVNARLDVDGHRISILQATMNAKTQAVLDKNELKIHQFDNVISYLEYENAVAEPSLFEERALCENSVRVMPM